ncbi:PPC domain-containing DNA-binding protein [Allorhizocola rhizosphaerae]|uniref:PPC domain-containing DNA-binding protein n=1 Tax=Allorhizocola rhizosphaerae TaxID=1872709 RepID=UPI0013C2F013
MQTHAFRLVTGQDLKRTIEDYVRQHCIGAGYILTCVGGLSRVVLRMPGAKDFVELDEDVEIITVQGTLSPEGCHLHASVSDKSGSVFGGHLSDGCIVRLTTEVALVDDTSFNFAREFDDQTGYKELVVTPKSQPHKPSHPVLPGTTTRRGSSRR